MLVAILGVGATIGPVLWNLSRIRRVEIPKDNGVDPATVSSVALPKVRAPPPGVTMRTSEASG